jgi:hypothetical protein
VYFLCIIIIKLSFIKNMFIVDFSYSNIYLKEKRKCFEIVNELIFKYKFFLSKSVHN